MIGAGNQFLIPALLRYLRELVTHGKVAVIKTATELNALLGALHHAMQTRVSNGNVIIFLVVVPGQLPVAIPNFKGRLPMWLVGLRRVEIYTFAKRPESVVNTSPSPTQVDEDMTSVNF